MDDKLFCICEHENKKQNKKKKRLRCLFFFQEIFTLIKQNQN